MREQGPTAGFHELAVSPTRLPETQIAPIKLAMIRRDGETQCRASLDGETIAEYAAQMAEGAIFPPITLWFDNDFYWVSDGFQRIAAAELLQREEIIAEIHFGTVVDARWDSCRSNFSHGLRRNKCDLANAIQRAIAHPNAINLSSREIAKHLNIPEPTFRRWKNKVSASLDADTALVHRKGAIFEMNVAAINRNRVTSNSQMKAKSHKALRCEFAQMKEAASPDANNLLNILGHWLFGAAKPTACVAALETIAKRWQGQVRPYNK